MNKRCWPVYNLLGQGNTLDFVTISVVLYKNGGCKINGKGRNILNLNQLSTTQNLAGFTPKNCYKRYTTVL